MVEPFQRATDDDVELMPRVLVEFCQHSGATRQQQTTMAYLRLIKKLFLEDGYSLETMASDEYYQDVLVRPENLSRNGSISNAIKAFAQFWRERPAELRELTPEERLKSQFQIRFTETSADIPAFKRAAAAQMADGAGAEPKKKSAKKKETLPEQSVAATVDAEEGADAAIETGHVAADGATEPKKKNHKKKLSLPEELTAAHVDVERESDAAVATGAQGSTASTLEVVSPEQKKKKQKTKLTLPDESSTLRLDTEALDDTLVETGATDDDELHTDPIYTWFDVRGKRGEDVLELPANWPEGIEVFPDRWAMWLPEGWYQGRKSLNSKSQFRECYISPEGKTYWQRSSVEKIVGTELPSVWTPVWPNFLPRDCALSHKHGIKTNRVWIFPQGDDFCLVWHESAECLKARLGDPTKKLKPVSLPQETAERLREAGRKAREEAPHLCTAAMCDGDTSPGYTLFHSAESQWIVFPDDVVSIEIDAFSKFFADAGWKVVSQTPEQRTFTGEVDLKLFGSGKLLVQCEKHRTVVKIAELYTDLLCSDS